MKRSVPFFIIAVVSIIIHIIIICHKGITDVGSIEPHITITSNQPGGGVPAEWILQLNKRHVSHLWDKFSAVPVGLPAPNVTAVDFVSCQKKDASATIIQSTEQKREISTEKEEDGTYNDRSEMNIEGPLDRRVLPRYLLEVLLEV